MRILVVNQYFHPDLASTAQLLTELCNDLVDGHEVHVVCGRPSYGVADGTQAGERPDPRIRIRRVRSTTFDRYRMTGRLANYATFLVAATWAALRAPRPDVVLTMTDPPVVAGIAAATALLRRVPYVYTCQDIFPDIAVALGKLNDGSLRRTLSWLNRVLRKRATSVVAIGHDMRERLIALGTDPDKILVIPNWADGERIVPDPEAGARFRRSHGWEDRFVVMHSGNVGLSQQLDILVDAAARLREHDEILFAIIGDGASKPALEREVAARALDNVRFLPYMAKEALSASLGAADLHVVGLAPGLAGLIVPSKMYGIMAAGKPFVAAVQAGSEPAVVVETAACGIRVDPGDAAALAEAILALRATDLAPLGVRARAAFEAGFDRPRSVQAYRNLLEEAARRGR